ncbi:ATP-binding protein [Nocardia salmonicida]|uniref:ATP-binding protein n=1 Tax=Nocardia salmonicida TaxID=53431 RepID=UPI0009FE808D|nr:ATP-binding protein [Nocardia salmonicida]
MTGTGPVTEADARLHQAAAHAGLAERWLAKLGVIPAYRKQEPHDPDEPGQEPFNPFAPFTSLPPIPAARGDYRPFGGYAHNVDAGRLFAGTTSQVQGLYPFPAASGARVRGVPFGRHLHTAEPIGLDPSQWLVDGLVTNTGLWVQGQPGIGKSTAIKRLLVGLVAFGFAAVIPGDIKDEYTALVEALDGKVFRIGRGLHSLNPLDLGPLRGAIDAAVGTQRDQLVSQARGRRLDLLESLITIVGGQDLTATERLLLAMTVDQADAANQRHGLPDPTIPELVQILDSATEPLLRVVAARDEHEYRRETRELRNTLVLLCEGPIKGMFDRPSSFSLDADLPAISLSLGAVEDDGDDVVAAAMMCAWAWSAGLIEGKQAAGQRRNVFQPQDELWRALRAAPGLVEKSDRMTRLNRKRGVVSAQSTHTITDLEALPTASDRAKAKGMVARNDIKVIGGLDHAEMERLHEISPFTSGEKELVTRWAAPPTWVPGQRHPGRGKYLIKSGARMGLPVHVDLTPEELELYNTDGAFAGLNSSTSEQSSRAA